MTAAAATTLLTLLEAKGEVAAAALAEQLSDLAHSVAAEPGRLG